jgi:hypothetical protein
MAVPGAAALVLAGCTEEESATRSNPAGEPGSTATEEAPDPDRVALDRAIAVSAGLLAALQAQPALDAAGRLAQLHASHLTVLREAAGESPTAASPSPSGPPLTVGRLRRKELAAQRELARLAQHAESGALARVFASMSAGIAAGLSHRGEVPA